MKRIRKLTIEIEQREITVAISLPGNAQGGSGHAPATSEPESARGNQGGTGSCPTCGAAVMVPLADALASCRGGQDVLSRALTGGDIHLSRSGSGLWLCEDSLRSFLAKFPLDSKETHE